MISDFALSQFKRQRQQGQFPKRLVEGAIDAMPGELKPSSMKPDDLKPSTVKATAAKPTVDQDPGLSDNVTQGLSSLSTDTKKRLHAFLGRALDRDRMAGDQDEPDGNNQPDSGDLYASLCNQLIEAGYPEDQVRELVGRVRQMCGDDLHMPDVHLHAAKDGDAVVPIRKAYDQPPPFPGMPIPGGGQVPQSSTPSTLDEARAAVNSVKVSPYNSNDAVSFNKSLRAKRFLAHDSASLSGYESFAQRWPELMRVKVL
jgi:hypothetical protein